MRSSPFAPLLALALSACLAPSAELTRLPSQDLLNRLPAQLGGLAAQGPARLQNETASRVYFVTGMVAVVTLGTPNATTTVPDGPDSIETRVRLEQLASNLVMNVQPVPPFGPWRREADLRVQNADGPPLRCTVLRRPRAAGAQVEYTCMTGLHARYLSVTINANHDAMSAQGVQTLAANIAGNLARMLATGSGLVVPGAATASWRAPQPKAPVVAAAEPPGPGFDDAVPE